MNDLVIGNARYKRQKFFATIWLSAPEELVVAGGMKRLGYTSLDRGEIARKLLVSFMQETLSEGMVGDPLMRIKAELDRLEVSSVALDEAAARLPIPKTKKESK